MVLQACFQIYKCRTSHLTRRPLVDSSDGSSVTVGPAVL